MGTIQSSPQTGPFPPVCASVQIVFLVECAPRLALYCTSVASHLPIPAISASLQLPSALHFTILLSYSKSRPHARRSRFPRNPFPLWPLLFAPGLLHATHATLKSSNSLTGVGPVAVPRLRSLGQPSRSSAMFSDLTGLGMVIRMDTPAQTKVAGPIADTLHCHIESGWQGPSGNTGGISPR